MTTLPNSFGDAALVQWVPVVNRWRQPLEVFMLDARCLSTGKVFADGYHWSGRDVSRIKMVHCPHCRDWHWLRISGEAFERRPVRLLPVTN